MTPSHQFLAYLQLGIGSIGTLVAHHLRHATQAPISLIYRRARLIRPLTADGEDDLPAITLSVQRGASTSTTTGFDAEYSSGFDVERTHSGDDRNYPADYSKADPANADIDSLVVCLKTQDTLSALRLLSPRLDGRSVVTLLQNGMGVYDQLCEQVFPDPESRPYFVLGTTTHGVTAKPRMHGSVRHMSKPGEGEMKFGVVPDPREEADISQWLWPNMDTSAQHIISPPPSPSLPLSPPPTANMQNLHDTLHTLLSMSELSPKLLPMPHLHHQLLVKLAINSVVNPLTSILGLGALPNGALLTVTPGYRLIRQVIAETSSILVAYIRSLAEPDAPATDVLRLFSEESLELRCLEVIRSTRDNTSSMAADISRSKLTEVNEINGYLVGLAARLGVPAPLNRMLTEMVKYTAAVSYPGPNVPDPYRLALTGLRGHLAESSASSATQIREKEEERRLAASRESLELKREAVALKEAERRLEIKERRRMRKDPNETNLRRDRWLATRRKGN